MDMSAWYTSIYLSTVSTIVISSLTTLLYERMFTNIEK